jgi:YidC/Oxa1 family membrane protein insertase
MDLPRYLLIAAMAALSFMLLTRWVDFSEQRGAETVAQTGSVASPIPAELPTPAEDAPPTATVPDDGDVPVVAPEQASQPAATPVATASLINVSTDVLELAIDLEGGDITRAALLKHLAKLDDPDRPFVLLQQDSQRTYVAQSGLVGANGIDSDGRAGFTADQSSYTLADGADQLVVDLKYRGPGNVDIIKRYTLRRGDYLVDIQYVVANNSAERWQASLFGQTKRDSSDDPSRSTSGGMGLVPFLGVALTQPDERFTKFDFEEMAENPFRQQLTGGWIAMIQHYFLSAWIPAAEQVHSYYTRVTGSGFNIGGFTSPALVIDPGNTGTTGASFYVGPKDQYRLEEISEYLDLSVDYGWLWWIAQPLFWLLVKIHSLVGNWGVAIILLTVLIKAAFFQLSATSYKSMANMRRVQPQMVDIRERYADDKQKQSQAMMDLYKKEKINPLGGCLPILVQMPVFIALYWVLMESVELRHAPFFGWIHDLSVMDPFFILPLIMGASMWFQQKLNPPPPDPMQAKVMQWMPVIFTFFFLFFPAGLVLYWVANNLLSIAQQWFITRQIEKAAATA